jgi:RimJ/RimL family protein N-acetyltransferase
MIPMPELHTERLLLRHWRDDDLDAWAAMNADPAVREHFPEVLDRDASAASMALFAHDLTTRGYGWWAVEVAADGAFIGMAGLDPVDDGMPVTGLEIGWRLSRASWGHGYATEAARACLEFGFETLGLPEIVAVTTAANVRSRAVMDRIGMTHDPSLDFDDPDAPPGPLRRTVIYRTSPPELGPQT